MIRTLGATIKTINIAWTVISTIQLISLIKDSRRIVQVNIEGLYGLVRESLASTFDLAIWILVTIDKTFPTFTLTLNDTLFTYFFVT